MQSKIIDARAEETRERVVRRFHDGLAFHVERSIQQHGNAGDRIKFLEQSTKTFVLVWPNGLHACGTVNVNDRRDFVPPFRANAFDDQHEWGFLIAFEDFACSFRKSNWCERPGGLSVLKSRVAVMF